MTRDHLRELVCDAGGEFHESPKRSTQLFIVGTVDVRSLANGEKLTSKHRRALELFDNESGIEIISSDDFLEFLIPGD